jgi:O-antigen/teichoic acid export membrane protein
LQVTTKSAHDNSVKYGFGRLPFQSAGRWARILLEFGLNQGLAQAAGMVSGLIYVRILPVNEYALFALCLSFIAFVSLGSDLGLTGSLSYFWRHDNGSFAAKVTAVRKLRSLLLMGALFVFAALFWRACSRQSWSNTVTIACFIIVAATTWAQTRSAVELSLVRLSGRQRESYYCEAAGSFARLATAIGLFFLGAGVATLALIGNMFGVLAVLMGLRYVRVSEAGPSTSVSREDWREVGAYLIPVIPGILIYIIQDPLVVWLTEVRGGNLILSETFALGRIGAIFTLLTHFIVIVVSPTLARVREDGRFAKLLFIAVFLAAAFGASLTAVIFMVPWMPLLLLGARYAHLTTEVVIVTISATLVLLTTILTIANRLRGWVRLDPVFAIVQGTGLVGLSLTWSFANTHNVVMLNLVLATGSLFTSATISFIGLRWPELASVKRGSR